VSLGETARSDPVVSVDRLLFHRRCGLHAAVINSQCTAHRPQSVVLLCTFSADTTSFSVCLCVRIVLIHSV